MEVVHQQRRMDAMGSKPWGSGKADLESSGSAPEGGGDDCFDSGIGSLSELQARHFGPVEPEPEPEVECGQPLAEPDVWPSGRHHHRQRLESGVGQITRGIEQVELGGQDQNQDQETLTNISQLLAYRTENLDSILHLAVIHEEESFLDHVLDFTKGTNYLDLQNDMKQTALHLAVIVGRPELVTKLVSAGANLLLQEKNGNTALHLACKEMATGCVQALLSHRSSERKDSSLFDPSHFRQQLHCYNYQGFTPLHVAVMLNDVHIVEYLLWFEVDVNAKEKCGGRTALHLAVEQQSQQIVKLLLDRRADVNAQMYNGCTPICLAVYRPDSGVTQLLRDYGSSEPVTDEESDEDEGIDEDGMGEYDDLVVHGC